MHDETVAIHGGYEPDATRAVAVPIYGKAESMNLATAASVCLYESAFAQRSADARA